MKLDLFMLFPEEQQIGKHVFLGKKIWCLFVKKTETRIDQVWLLGSDYLKMAWQENTKWDHLYGFYCLNGHRNINFDHKFGLHIMHT